MMVQHNPLEHGGKGTNDPRMIVVHSMGEFIKDPKPKHATDFLDGYGLSAHALIDPKGVVFVCREDHQIAWHARGHNTGSLGVEFLVSGNHDYASFLKAIEIPGWAPKAQMDAGITWVRNWVKSYHIDPDNIVRHSDISPGRKLDPGSGFPWEEFHAQVIKP